MTERFRLYGLASWLMIGMAIGIAMYVTSNVAYTADNQATLTHAWDRSHPLIPQSASSTQTTGVGVAPVVAFQHPRVAYGQPMAKIQVPSINWTGIVLEGSELNVLAGGPGHVVTSAYPGEDGNVVISNHNSFSLAWGNVKVGDPIILQTDYGTYTYRVTGFKIVEADDRVVTSLGNGQPTLTFTTCYPLYAGALAHQRYAVFADLVQ